MNSQWPQLAQRIIQGLDVQTGEIIQVRGDPGPYEFLFEIQLAIEAAGATPLLELFPSNYLRRLWAGAPLGYLSNWDQHRAGWLKGVDRVVMFMWPPTETNSVPKEKIEAWGKATGRLSAIEDELRLPILVVFFPTEAWAGALGVPYARLESILLPALLASPQELRIEATRLLEAIGNRQELAIHTGDGCDLRFQQGDRSWLIDDGVIDLQDRQRGAIVSNLPAGSIYTTVLESETQGSLWLPKAGDATEVTFFFRDGRIMEIQAANGAEQLRNWIFSHSGEPGRVSHVGIGLNPYLKESTGWNILVDEHVHGALFLALGDNRYMGGQNASSLNTDFAIQRASFSANGTKIVTKGDIIFQE